MPAIMLPPTVTQFLPTLQALNGEQKLFIIKEILADKLILNVSDIQANDMDNTEKNLAWEMGKDMFGNYASGRHDLSTQAKSVVKQKIRQKYGKNPD